MKLSQLRICNIAEPLGYAMESPVLSWKTEEAAGKQAWASLRVSTDESTVFESIENKDADSLGWVLDFPLNPRTRYHCFLTVCSDSGETASAETWFETGKRDEAWNAEWISPVASQSSAVLRRTFSVSDTKTPARLYICALGLYEVYINGQYALSEYLRPGYHSYDFHLETLTADVTRCLREGENTIDILLGEGWFKGRLGFDGGYTNLYGDRLYAIAEMYQADQLLLKTDEHWNELNSPITFANIYDGETWDARIKPQVFGHAQKQHPEGTGRLQDRVSLPVKELDRFPVKELIHTPKGDTVLDFGQNLTGWVHIDSDLPADAHITLTAGEIMQDDEFYHDNYRTAISEFSYISDGTKRIVRPHFTFFGFRYMKVDCDVPVRAEQFTAVHLRSAMDEICAFECGNELVNKLYLNAMWGIKDNLLEVPTDCPQRDERLGWTGDAQAISSTACQMLYMPAFYRKYLWDMRAEQSILNGSVPNVVPRIKRGQISESGSCPWADAGVIIPWNTWLYYGNKSLLAENYPGMKAWVDFQRSREEAIEGPHLVKDGFHFADWLALDNPVPGPFGATDPLYIASAYYYRCTSIVAQAAEILGYEEASEYQSLARDILKAIQEVYFDENGICRIHTQTAAALAITFRLTDKVKEQSDLLRELIAKENDHLNTGFVGTPILCSSLSETGHHDTAVTLLLQEDFPSWLYSVKLGATTIWERWNSVMPDGHINSEGMNSLNHYTYGSIAGWMISWLCGVRPLAPGYRTAVIEPMPDPRLGYAKGIIDTAYGKYCSEWKYEGDAVRYEITVPFGATAEVRLPGQDVKVLTAGTYHYLERKFYETNIME